MKKLIPTLLVAIGLICSNRAQDADNQLNDVYKQLMSKLDEAGRKKLKQDEIKWIKDRDAIAAASSGLRSEVLELETIKRVKDLQSRLNRFEEKNTANSIDSKRENLSDGKNKLQYVDVSRQNENSILIDIEDEKKPNISLPTSLTQGDIVLVPELSSFDLINNNGQPSTGEDYFGVATFQDTCNPRHLFVYVINNLL
jgi:hypothetical protein